VDEAISTSEIESKVAGSLAIGLEAAIIKAKNAKIFRYTSKQGEDLSQNGKAILATISTTHYLLSTSSKQGNK